MLPPKWTQTKTGGKTIHTKNKMTIRTFYIFSVKENPERTEERKAGNREAKRLLLLPKLANRKAGENSKKRKRKRERDSLPEIAKAFARKKVEKERLKIVSYKRTKRQKPRHNNNKNSQKFKFKTLTDLTLPPSVPAGKIS